MLDQLSLTVNDFGCEIKISVQIALSRHWRIPETEISYYGRTYDEGTKIDWRDGLKALGYLIRLRFSPLGFSRRF